MMIKFMFLLIKLQLVPMLIAVSTLSPVKTQSLMPALAILSMHSGTPNCSLSSMAVAPSSTRLCSYLFATWSTRSSLLSNDVAAAFISLTNVSYSAVDIVL
eukprot:NODE_53_length_26956_cov_0.387348.p18 type:complete len:101 gc:universal NODE_53_length_26956_cov_0.387348:12581-12883(+)